MKLQARLPWWKLGFAILGLQALAVVFVMFRETIMLDIAQLFWILAMGVIGFQVFKQRGQSWQSTQSQAPTPFLTFGLKCFAMFAFLLLFLWQFNYLSLYTAQPLMFSIDDAPVVFDIQAGDLLGLTLKLGLQTWLLALALALVFNRLPEKCEFGFLRGKYKPFDSIVWLLTNFAGGALVIALMFVLSLLTLDISKFVVTAFGGDVINVPQLDTIMFMFAMFLMVKTTGLTEKMKNIAKKPDSLLITIPLYQMLFVFMVYGLFMLMMQFIPADFVYELMQPFYFEFFDFNTFPEFWQLFVTAMSLFFVPVLAYYIYSANKGRSLSKTVIPLMVIPMMVCAAVIQLIPAAQVTFLSLVPEVDMFLVDLNDITSRYHISVGSFLSVMVAMGLFLTMKRSQTLVDSMVNVLPMQIGGRERRLKTVFAHGFPLFTSILFMYMLAGAYISVYFSSLFLLATLVTIGLSLGEGFFPHKFKSQDIAVMNRQEA